MKTLEAQGMIQKCIFQTTDIFFGKSKGKLFKPDLLMMK